MPPHARSFPACRQTRNSARRRLARRNGRRAERPAFDSPRVREVGRGRKTLSPRFRTARGLLAEIGSDLLVATCGADDVVGLNAVVMVGPEALLFLWRGYADPAPR